MLYSAVYAVVVGLSVCSSVTSRCFTEMVKHRVKQHSAQWRSKKDWRIAMIFHYVRKGATLLCRADYTLGLPRRISTFQHLNRNLITC